MGDNNSGSVGTITSVAAFLLFRLVTIRELISINGNEHLFRVHSIRYGL